jgi:hypothetical protein
MAMWADPDFSAASCLFHPDTLERSLFHDGSGPVPGIKDDSGRWDLRAHKARLSRVNSATLRLWAQFDSRPARSAVAPRYLFFVTDSLSVAFERIVSAPRLAARLPFVARGLVQDEAQRDGLLLAQSRVNDDLRDVVYQGPHIFIANAFYQEPNPTMRNHRDFTRLDLEALDDHAIPRTSFQRARSRLEFAAAFQRWKGRPATEYWRLAWRRRVDVNMERTLLAAIIPRAQLILNKYGQ